MAGPVKWVVEITSGSVRYANGEAAAQSSFADSLNALREQRRAFGFARPVGAVAAVALLGTLSSNLPVWVSGAVAVGGAAATYFARRQDLARRSAVMHYELDRNVADAWRRLVEAAKGVASCGGLWQMVQATIGGGEERKALSMQFTAPEFLVTNVDSFAMAWADRTMHFFPDRVLIYAGANAYAISYRQLQVSARPLQVAEENTPPDDAKVVGHKWRHATPDGSPDPNAPVNRELPLCEYGEVRFLGPQGLVEALQCSKADAARELTRALRTLSSLVPDSA